MSGIGSHEGARSRAAEGEAGDTAAVAASGMAASAAESQAAAPAGNLPRVLIVAEHASARFGGEAVLALHYVRVLRRRGRGRSPSA